MYQQVVSEGHVLLRNQLTNQSDPSSKLLPLLRQSCSRLAGSLCGFPAKDVTVAMAARYFLLSRLSVAEVFQFISKNFDKVWHSLHSSKSCGHYHTANCRGPLARMLYS